MGFSQAKPKEKPHETRWHVRSHARASTSGSLLMQFNHAIQEFGEWRKLKKPNTKGDNYVHHLRIFCLYLRNPDIESIKLADVTEYLHYLKELGFDPNSFPLRNIAIKKFFEFFALQGYNVPHPELIPIPRPEYRVPRVATEAEYRKIVSYMKNHTRLVKQPKPNGRKDAWQRNIRDPRHVRNLVIVGLLHDTGARVGEICSLNLADINIKDRCAIIRTEKTRGRRPFRYIFWSEAVNKDLKFWIERREEFTNRLRRHNPKYNEDALFIGITGLNHGKRIRTSGVAEFLRSYSRKLQIYPFLNAHSWRHQLAHDILDKTGNMVGAKETLGHSSILSTQHYLKLNKQETRRYWQAAREGQILTARERRRAGQNIGDEVTVSPTS